MKKEKMDAAQRKDEKDRDEGGRRATKEKEKRGDAS